MAQDIDRGQGNDPFKKLYLEKTCHVNSCGTLKVESTNTTLGPEASRSTKRAPQPASKVLICAECDGDAARLSQRPEGHPGFQPPAAA